MNDSAAISASPDEDGLAAVPSTLTEAPGAAERSPARRRSPALRVVCIEDEADDVELIRMVLARAKMGAEVSQVDSESALLRSLCESPNVLLCDYSMPGFSAERALAVLAEGCHDVPLVVVTRAIGEEAVVNLFRAGAKDYVAKGKLALLPAVIVRVLSERALALERLRIIADLAHANERLRQLSAHMVHAQERERTRIARELHDGLGQALTGIVLQLHAASRSESAELAEQRRGQALEMAHDAIRQVKSMSFELRPAQLEMLGFVAAVRAMLDRQRDATGLQSIVMLRGAPPEEILPAHAVALRILQEAITNVLRHAGASQMVVRLHFDGSDHFVMAIGDDGQGFDAKAVLAAGISAKNVGLIGMHERAELMGGRLRCRSTEGRGCVLRLSL